MSKRVVGEAVGEILGAIIARLIFAGLELWFLSLISGDPIAWTITVILATGITLACVLTPSASTTTVVAASTVGTMLAATGATAGTGLIAGLGVAASATVIGAVVAYGLGALYYMYSSAKQAYNEDKTIKQVLKESFVRPHDFTSGLKFLGAVLWSPFIALGAGLGEIAAKNKVFKIENKSSNQKMTSSMPAGSGESQELSPPAPAVKSIHAAVQQQELELHQQDNVFNPNKIYCRTGF